MLRRSFCYNVFNQNIKHVKSKNSSGEWAVGGYTNSSQVVLIKHNDTKQAKQSEIQPGRIAINVYYSIIFHRYSTK